MYVCMYVVKMSLTIDFMCMGYVHWIWIEDKIIHQAWKKCGHNWNSMYSTLAHCSNIVELHIKGPISFIHGCRFGLNVASKKSYNDSSQLYHTFGNFFPQWTIVRTARSQFARNSSMPYLSLLHHFTLKPCVDVNNKRKPSSPLHSDCQLYGT